MTDGSLNVGDALTGILAAGARVIAGISTSSSPPTTHQDVQEELCNLRLILSSMQRFVVNSSGAHPQRAGLVELEDVATVMTQPLLLHSELEVLIGDWFQDDVRGWVMTFLKPGGRAIAARLLSRL